MARKFEDLTGRIFSHLTVIEFAGMRRRGITQWSCLCDCGNTKIVSRECLISGDTKSCGCITHKQSKSFKNIIGIRFGNLTVIEMSGKYKNGSVLWRCKCDCGNETIKRGNDLRSGKSVSCPKCADINHRLDLSGKTFGRLTAIRVTRTAKNGATIWLCRCSCEDKSEIEANGQNLINGNVQSCGCIKRLDLVGQTFGRLTVVEYSGLKNQSSLWKCSCSCGNVKIILGVSLTSGKTQSCGCYGRDRSAEYHTIHGMCGTPEYNRYIGNRRREKSNLLDSGWTMDMERCLSKMFSECVVCGGADRLATDHVYPLDLGYGLSPGNAVKLCVHCNSSKRNRTPSDLPKTLPLDAGEKILKAAQDFKDYWESLNIK
jgi:hypothetical protein